MIFGCLMFLATAAFAGGLVFSLVSMTWDTMPLSKGLIGFFGFGVPMAICAMATAELWWDSRGLMRLLGGVTGLIALGLAGCLFVLIGGWVYGDPFPISKAAEESHNPRLWYVLAFAIPMVAAVLFSSVTVVEAERKV